MLCSAGRRALSWASLLLLVGFQPQGTRAWCSEKDAFYISPDVSDPDTVTFALSAFNKESKDEYAYRLSQLLSFSKAQTKQPETFSMKMKLERTICKKFEESLDTCPFQESHELNNTITCFFTISTQRSAQQFRVLKKTCSEGLP